MKKFYIIITLAFTSFINAQTYEFALVHNSGYNFSVVAVPDFDSTGNTDISDIGFALMLPAGNADVTNISQFNGRAWTATEVTAAQLDGLSLGDGTRDGFAMNLPPGQTMLSHTSDQQIVLITFDVSNMPLTGELEILLNTDPIAIGLGGAVNSFYNANIDSSTTQDYFGGVVAGQDSFSFDSLGIDDNEFSNSSISIYPNPSHGTIHITSQHLIDTVSVYSILGHKVAEFTNTSQLDISQLTSGVYLLKIMAQGKTSTKKIVIK